MPGHGLGGGGVDLNGRSMGTAAPPRDDAFPGFPHSPPLGVYGTPGTEEAREGADRPSKGVRSPDGQALPRCRSPQHPAS